MSRLVSSGGINDSLKGATYQLELMKLFACNATHLNINFKLSTEIKEAGKFDDLIYEYESNDGKVHCRLLQAKHKLNPINMALDMLLIHKDFALCKYFKTLEEVKQNFDNIDDVILATNHSFQNIGNDMIEVYDLLKTEKIILEKTGITDPYLTGVGFQYKFASRNHQVEYDHNVWELKKFLIACDLIKCMFSSVIYNLTNADFALMCDNHQLIDEIYDINLMEFKDDFIDGTNSTTSSFRKHFSWAITYISHSKNKITNAMNQELVGWNSKDIWEYLRKKKDNANIAYILGLPKTQKILDQTIKVDTEIREFFDKFVYLVKAGIPSVANATLQCLTDKFQIHNHTQIYSDIFQSKLKNWVIGVDVNNPITSDFVKACFQEVSTFSDTSFITFYSQEVFNKYGYLEFDLSVAGLDNDFLTSDKILYLQTPNQETILLGLKIKQFFSVVSKNFVFLRTSYPDDVFSRGLKAFTSKSITICVLEINEAIRNIHREILIAVQNDPLLKLIVISDNQNFFQQNICELKIRDYTVWSELTDDSKLTILANTILFQGNEVFLKDLISDFDADDRVLEILNINTIYNQNSGSFGNTLYIKRTIHRKINIMEKIMEDWERNSFQDKLTFSEDEFNSACQANPKQNIHWLMEVDNQTFVWKMSSNKISNLCYYIDTSNNQTLDEISFCRQTTRVLIVTDSAGMGKSKLFESLTDQLKKESPNYWVIKLDLNNYTDHLEGSQDFQNDETIIQFMCKYILNLQNNMETKLFEHACFKTGAVHILFDGFDEVAQFYKDKILALVKFFEKHTKGMILISTRSEWKDELEDEFSEISYSLAPFTQVDQKVYLKNIWEAHFDFDAPQVEEIADLVLQQSTKFIKDRDRSLTGIPLIVMLLAEYIKNDIDRLQNNDSCISFADILKHLEGTNYNLFILYEDFVEKLIRRHLIERAKLQTSNFNAKNIMDRELKALKKLHGRFAMNTIFSEDTLDYLPSNIRDALDDEELAELVNCGLIVKQNDQLKCIHYTFLEHFAAVTLTEKFDNPKVATFIVKFVLEGESYRFIRLLINSRVSNFDNPRNSKLYSDVIIKLDPTSVSILHNAAKEQNLNTFAFLLNSILKNVDGHTDTIKTLLSSCDFKGGSIFYYYFHFCDDTLNILEQIKNAFGLDFVKEVLLFRSIMNRIKANPVIAATWHGRNYVNLIQWTFENFHDSMTLRAIIMSKDQDGDGILHNGMENHDSDTFIKLLEILHNNRSRFGLQNFFQEFILERNIKGNFFLALPSIFQKESRITDTLNWVKQELNNKDLLRNFVFNLNYKKATFLFDYFNFYPKKFLSTVFSEICGWIVNEFGMEDLKKLLFIKNMFGQTILFEFLVCGKDEETAKFFIKILDDLYNLLDGEITDLVLVRNSEGSTLLHHLSFHYSGLDVSELLISFIKWTKAVFGEHKMLELLLEHDKINTNFLCHLFSNKNVENPRVVTDILESLKKELMLDQNTIEEILISNKYPLLHCLARRGSRLQTPSFIREFLFWIKKELGSDILEKILMSKTFEKQHNFLHEVILLDRNNEAPELLIEILMLLKNDLGINLLIIKNLIFNRPNQSLLQYYAEEYKTSNLSTLFITCINWILAEFGMDVAKELLVIEDDEKKNFLQYMALNRNEKLLHVSLIEILNWIKEKFDIDFIRNLIFCKNSEECTMLINFTWRYSLPEISKVICKLTAWVHQAFGISELIDWLKSKDDLGRTFLNYFVINSEQYDPDVMLIEVLNFLKNQIKLDKETLKELLFLKDNEDCSLLEYYVWRCSKPKLPKLFKELILWIRNELGMETVEELLKLKDNLGRIFLHYIVLINPAAICKPSINPLHQSLMNALSCLDTILVNPLKNEPENEDDLTQSTLLLILDFLEKDLKLDKSLIKNLVLELTDDGKTLLHYFTIKFTKAYLPKLLNEFIKWIEISVNCETAYEILLAKDNDGNMFLKYLIFDSDNDGVKTLIDVLEHLKTKRVFSDVICSTNTRSDSILHFIGRNCKTSSLREIFSMILEWLCKSSDQGTSRKLLLHFNEDGHNFIEIIFRRMQIIDSNTFAEFILILDPIVYNFPSYMDDLFNTNFNVLQTLADYVHETCRKANLEKCLPEFDNLLDSCLTDDQRIKKENANKSICACM
jgi:hypothetical protein